MTDPWRFRCPEGHTSLKQYKTGGYRCHSCDRRYHGDPVDMTADGGDVKQSSEPVTRLGPLKITHMLWRETGDTDTTTHARNLPVRTKAAANALVKAEERGYVGRIERSRASRWYVTESGERIVTFQGARSSDDRAGAQA